MYTYYLKFSRDDDEDRKNWGNESEKSLIDQISGEGEILVEWATVKSVFTSFQFNRALLNSEMINDGVAARIGALSSRGIRRN